MQLLITCPCKQKLKIGEDKRGKKIKCPACQRVLKIPERKTETKTDDSLWDTLPSTQMTTPSAYGSNYNTWQPTKMQAPKKTKGASGRNWLMLLGGLGVCIVLAGAVGLTFWFMRDTSTAKVSENSIPAESVVTFTPGTTASQNQDAIKNELGGFVPSNPYAMVNWPKPVLEGAAFDILKFVEQPPANENAAPFYLDAFFDFSPELEACFVGSPTLADRLKSVKERVKLDKVFSKPYSAEKAAEWKSTLKLYDEGFNKMVLAQKRPKCMFQTDFSYQPLCRLTSGAYSFGKVASYRSTINLREGDFSSPLEAVEMMLRLSRDLRKPNKSGWVNANLEEMAESTIREMFLTTGMKVEHYDQLLSSLDRHIRELGDDTLSRLQGDYVYQRLFVYELMSHTGYFSRDRMREFAKKDTTSNLYGDSAESQFASLALFYLSCPNWSKPQENASKYREVFKSAVANAELKREFRFIDELFKRNMELATKPFSERWAGTRQRNEGIWIGVELDMNNLYLARVAIMDKTFVYNLTLDRTKLHALKALVALRRWQIKHNGAIPTSLEQVMKDSGYPALPIDPFSNKPLLFTVLNGKPVIYSVGPNGIDEQAKIESKFVLEQDWTLRIKTDPTQSKGDLVFRIGK